MKKIILLLFGPLAEKLQNQFSFLKYYLSLADMKILLRTYLAIACAITFVVFFSSFVFMYLFFTFLEYSFIVKIVFSIAIALLFAIIAFVAMISYPISKAQSRKRNIETNLPFAIIHMSAIASSGVPPSTMFRLLTDFDEYGEIAREAKKIVQNIDVFGLDITTAIREVAKKTPSKNFKDFLEGVATTIDTGGDLHAFLLKESEKAMFEYKIRREKFLQTLSTYADIYTAVLIAAPLFLVAILSVMSMIEGRLWGLEIKDIMWLGIFVGIPALNTLFLAFIHFTQPEL
ncbi:MAG TPA: hypothetical protein EYH56_03690 [Nanoarchaeota archaeon]|nr:hypothetical protein [Nanoarchaeota archaeon]